MKLSTILIMVTAIGLTGAFFYTQSAGEKTYLMATKTPEAELAGFKLPPGFIIELVASERDGVINPIDITFDDAGRLWTQTARMYPLDPISDIQWDDLTRLMNDENEQKNHPNFKRILDLYQGKTKGTDKILVLSNLYSDKVPVKTTVWADGLTIPMSILPYKNGCYVAQGSEMFFLNDTNKDGKADERIPMFTGFGFTDTHTMAHALIRGPGDWIYFSHGALNKGKVTSYRSDVKLNIDYSKIARFSLDAQKMELVSSGLNNIWGFQLRNNGQWYGCEANDLGYSVVPMESGTGFPGIGNERIRDYQPWMPELHKFRIGGTGISGLAFADDLSGSFPSEWKDVAFLANPITSTINAVKIIRNADGTVTASHLPDLLTSEDKYFRPVNMEFGPDGCLYIADWYDKIISHNEVPTTHPDRDKSLGRIWRIRHVSQKVAAVPDLYAAKTKSLVDHLKSPSIWAKRAAWHQITDRPANETRKLTSALVAITGDKNQDEITRILALWSLEGIKQYDAKLMSSLLKDPMADLRREAVRSLAGFSLPAADVGAGLKQLIDDANPMVRSQVLRTLADLGKADSSTIALLLHASKPLLPGNEMGGSYERRFERYLALKALEQYPRQLYAFLNVQSKADIPVSNLFWAIQALPEKQKEEIFLTLWASSGIKQLDEPTFLLIAKMLTNKQVYEAVKPVFTDSENGVQNLRMAIDNQQQTQSSALSSLLEIPANKLLKSKVQAERHLALDAVGRLKITIAADEITALITDQIDEVTLRLVLKTLESDPKINKEVFLKILNNKRFNFELRLAALQGLAKADHSAALKAMKNWVPGFDTEERKAVVNVLSSSNEGAVILTEMYRNKNLQLEDFNLSAAERVFNADPKDAVGAAILEGVKDHMEAEKKLFNRKLTKYMALAAKNGGNAIRGKVRFQTCLMCHKVGDNGPGIAPALDGSASRENEALLTSILNPDAAVEGGYALYRVTKKDNSTVEGYLVQKEDRGTTISLMGGTKLFIEMTEIKNQGFLGGRSFMPKGLIENLSDDEVADLLAYIRTLK
ncbi:MAG: PVC-type heme-binding CxxCH protein [Sphingobacteriaceae bacterium]